MIIKTAKKIARKQVRKSKVKPLITVEEATKIFHLSHKKQWHDLTAISRASLDVLPGEFLVLLGPSGSGKSTLLRMIVGLDEPTEGAIHYNNFQVSDASFVFQHFALLPWLTVEKNIALGLHCKKLSTQAKHKLVSRELERFGLTKFRTSYPRELSGGMQQRVGLARALATDPKVILLDEPFSELDSFTAEELRQELLKIWRDTKITIVMVTHLISEAIEMADRIVALSPSPGRVEAVIKNTLTRPRNLRSEKAFALEDKLREILKP